MLKPTTKIVHFLCLLVLLTLSLFGPMLSAVFEDREVTSSSVMEEKYLKSCFNIKLPFAENSALDFPSYQILLEQYLADDPQRPPTHIIS